MEHYAKTTVIYEYCVVMKYGLTDAPYVITTR